MVAKPSIIKEIEAYYKVALSPSTETLEDFMRYGLKNQDKNKYLMDGTSLIGLNLRSNNLVDFPFVDQEALHQLQALYLGENKLTELTIPKEMSNLVYLDVGDNETLKTVRFEGDMPQLKSIELSDSGVEVLQLPNCDRLEKIDISRNQLKEFSFSGACPELTWLDLSGNEVFQSLLIPAGFDKLTHLHLSNCNLVDLKIKGPLPNLRVLDLKNNQLSNLPADIILDSPLTNLYAEGNYPKNIPDVFLEGDSLLESRVWFKELRDYPSEKNKSIKLMITGNGNVGKTTLMCALENGDEEEEVYQCSCEDPHDSTHGIIIGNWEDNGIDYNFWDFGGQEVYHGTHRLFLASEALQLIVFDPESEEIARQNEKIKDRIREEEETINHPIQYWYDTVHRLSPRSKVLIVQNKKGKFQEEDEKVVQFAKKQGLKIRHVDAITGEDVSDIPYELRKLARQLPAYNMTFPSSWMKVRDWLVENLEEDQSQNTIDLETFKNELCKGIAEKSTDLLMKYLHNGGYLYYNENLGDTIIIDQRWALNAIYKPYDRSAEHYQQFRSDEGEIRVSDLFEAFGPHYSEEEKWLFLSFMENCGLCFQLNLKRNEFDRERNLRSKFIFPEFLQVEEPSFITDEWENTPEVMLLQYKMTWPNYFLIQSFISKLGRKAESQNFWRNGIQIRTETGKFKVCLNYKSLALQIFIEKRAMKVWLEPLIEEFPTKVSWEISNDLGLNFESFSLEEWSEHKSELMLTAPADAPQHKVLDDLPEKIQEPLRKTMLFFAANPKPDTLISFEKEFTSIKKELQDKSIRKKLEILINLQSTFSEIVDLINMEKPVCVHFVGHGEEENPDTSEGGGIRVMNDNRREVETLSSRDLENAFSKIKKKHPQLELVFLNACFTEPQARAISKSGIYTLGTSIRIGSTNARRFAALFYKYYAQSLGEHNHIKDAAEFAAPIEKTADSNFRIFHNGSEI